MAAAIVPEDDIEYVKVTSEMCTIHPLQVFISWCLSCKQSCCARCEAEDHIEHAKIPIKEILTSCRTQMHCMVSRIQPYIDQIDHLLDVTRSYYVLAGRNLEEIKQTIVSNVQQIQAEVNKKQSELFRELGRLDHLKNHKVQQTEGRLHEFRLMFEKVHQEACSVMAGGTCSEIVKKSNLVKDQLDKLVMKSELSKFSWQFIIRESGTPQNINLGKINVEDVTYLNVRRFAEGFGEGEPQVRSVSLLEDSSGVAGLAISAHCIWVVHTGRHHLIALDFKGSILADFTVDNLGNPVYLAATHMVKRDASNVQQLVLSDSDNKLHWLTVKEDETSKLVISSQITQHLGYSPAGLYTSTDGTSTLLVADPNGHSLHMYTLFTRELMFSINLKDNNIEPLKGMYIYNRSNCLAVLDRESGHVVWLEHQGDSFRFLHDRVKLMVLATWSA